MSATPKINDYAVIGDGRSVALVSRYGSIDWLCWPRFDSAAIFGKILDAEVGGTWSIRPTQESQTTRRYIDNTNVLETEFHLSSGRIVLTDFMAEGHFVRHVRRMRTFYAERQETLLRALRRELDGLLDVAAFESGMHVLAWLPEGVDDRIASAHAAAAGIVARPLSACAATPIRRGGLLLGYAALRPSQIRDGVRRLAAALGRRG